MLGFRKSGYINRCYNIQIINTFTNLNYLCLSVAHISQSDQILLNLFSFLTRDYKYYTMYNNFYGINDTVVNSNKHKYTLTKPFQNLVRNN